MKKQEYRCINCGHVKTIFVEDEVIVQFVKCNCNLFKGGMVLVSEIK